MVLVWALRLLLPVLFFGIYFRLQGATKQARYEGPTTNVLTRERLLSLRKAVSSCPAPDSMQNIALKDQSQAPHLFTASGRAPRPERARRSPDEQRERVPRGEKREKDKREKKEPEPASAPEPEPNSLSSDKMHLESLLNYVAFNSQEQQRVFLQATAGGVPPNEEGRRAMASKIAGATAEEANAEAQMVLRGAMGIKRPDVAGHLYEQLMDAHVDISQPTFEIMIDICLLANDLKAASDFLMKMENSGFTPNSEMLDKVLDLYSKQQDQHTTTEQENSTKAERPTNDENFQDSEAAKLLAAVTEPVQEDPAMVPWAMPNAAMVPMFNWDAIEDSDDDSEPSEPTKMSSDAPVFVPSFMPGPMTSSAEDALNSLSATAQPFEPQYNMAFDPAYQTWTSWDQPTPEGQGKGKGKGKAKWKGKGEWEDGWHARSSAAKGEWDDGWHSRSSAQEDGWQSRSSGGKGERSDGWHSKSGGKDSSSQGEHSAQQTNKNHSKANKDWNKPQMTWRAKSDSQAPQD